MAPYPLRRRGAGHLDEQVVHLGSEAGKKRLRGQPLARPTSARPRRRDHDDLQHSRQHEPDDGHAGG